MLVTTPSPLLKEWAKAKLARGSWKDAIVSAVSVSTPSLWYPSFDGQHARFQFKLPRSAIYLVVCEHLKTTDRIADATECFHQMTRELGQDVTHRELLEPIFCE